MQYVRIYADSEGKSHFDEGEIALTTNNFAPPATPFNVSAPIVADQLVFIAMPPGWYGEWHPAPRRQYWLQTSGQIEVEVGDGEIRRFGPATVVLLEDVTGKGHVTRVIGDDEVTAAFVQLPR